MNNKKTRKQNEEKEEDVDKTKQVWWIKRVALKTAKCVVICWNSSNKNVIALFLFVKSKLYLSKWMKKTLK